MLTIPAPFPQVGSYALLDLPGATHLVRIQTRERVGTDNYALISFHGRPGAGGNRTVLLSDLTDGTPLTAAEAAEFARLDRADIADNPRSARAKAAKARRDALHARRMASHSLEEAMRLAGLERIAA